MPAKVSRRLVIDASVARAAGGEEATYPTSKHCRDLLQAVLAICHRVVLTPDITREWNTHQSRFARLWRVSMAARKKVYHTDISIDQELHNKIESSTASARKQEAMRKDMLLIAAVLRTDKTVVSLDDIARTHFAVASKAVGELRNIVRVNPGMAREDAITWLQNGAKPEKVFRLGFAARTRERSARRGQT
jgi:hypothetical protein